MEYKIIRIDRKEDEFKSQIFLNYADTYDLLKKYTGIYAVQILILKINILQYCGKIVRKLKTS